MAKLSLTPVQPKFYLKKTEAILGKV